MCVKVAGVSGVVVGEGGGVIKFFITNGGGGGGGRVEKIFGETRGWGVS